MADTAAAGRVLLIVCISILCTNAQQQVLERSEPKIVTIAQGTLKGYKAENADVFEFHGIPYATAPKGRDKFKAPLPGPKWSGTREAVETMIMCPQFNSFLTPMNMTTTEDCLVASVYTPYTEKTNLPVVVQIHGGAYQLGFGDWARPKTMVENAQVVYVNFNYRLGAHGFLCLGTEAAPGNAGMKDMLALLRWVKENIAAFGGDPDNVTITGYSAGSSAVHHLMLSKAAEGLFHKAIAESGTAISVWGIQRDPIGVANDFAKRFNGHYDNVYDLEDFYTSASLADLTSDAFLTTPESTFYFVPCVERDVGQEMFLTKAPLDILKSGDYNKVPLLIGHADLEGLFRADVFEDWKDKMNEKFSDFLPDDLHFDSDEEKETVANMVKKFYFGDKAISKDTAQGYVNYFGDIVFIYADVLAARLHTQNGDTVYLYDYTFYDSSVILPQIKKTKEPFPIVGPGHTAQSFAVYDILLPISVQESEAYKNVKSMTRQLWANFIKTGQPTKNSSDWPATTSSGAPWMDIGVNLELKTEPMIQERAKFWDDIYRKHSRQPLPPPLAAGRHNQEL